MEMKLRYAAPELCSDQELAGALFRRRVRATRADLARSLSHTRRRSLAAPRVRSTSSRRSRPSWRSPTNRLLQRRVLLRLAGSPAAGGAHGLPRGAGSDAV